MWRKIGDPKRTAAVNGDVLTVMYDDGWDNLLDYRRVFPSGSDAGAWLVADGWEEFDPHTDLKARGFVWNGYCYVKEGGAH
jgi:hypothetical protein